MPNLFYDPAQLETHWRAIWEQENLFQAQHTQVEGEERIYLLFAFAYPSGAGLHVGHVESMTALDILARYYRMQGKQVFFPVGWDAFGLPAENYAIKTGVPPAKTTNQAITTFRQQIKSIGISYDWANEIATCHPEYYKWTQWLFLQLYTEGLAYRGKGLVNWCPSCQTVLANEQVVDGVCERCGSEVEQRDLEQWFFKITQYRDELITGLDQVDWPEPTKQQQLNWIGKSEGAEVRFQVKGSQENFEVYTTAHDTIYGCTFMVIAPEHKFLQAHAGEIENWAEVAEYIEQAHKKSERERQIQRQKTGVLVKGLTLINPANNQEVPLYVADYVLAGYGTGAIMAVPGHDERDYEFAQKFELPVVPTAQLVRGKAAEFIDYSKIKQARSEYVLINSGKFDGLNYEKGRQAILDSLIEKKAGQARTEYKLRDWLISRQRYWGAPIPIVYDPEGTPHPVKEEHLPWLLPTDVDFNPKGQSPLHSSEEFIARTEKLYGKGWRPEFDTMDTFVDSSWYFLRYVDSRNTQVFASEEQLKAWLPVDFYMIGPEHIVLHLLYSRFFTKFLRDQGYLDFDEPFMKMRHQGMILGPDNRKMSKSKGNVINPDEVVEKFGADTLRMYEMFMGPIEADKPWDVSAVAGVHRFLARAFSVVSSTKVSKAEAQTKTDLEIKLHQTIQKVTQDIPLLKFNTAIAALMGFLNAWEHEAKTSRTSLTQAQVLAFIKLLSPFAPFLAEELYQRVQPSNHFGSVHQADWPDWDQALLKKAVSVVPIQINGRVRAQLEVAEGTDQETAVELAQQLPQVQKWLTSGTLKKVIYVPGKILNFVVA